MVMDIPFDLLSEILSRVPARSLLQCRCVCRSWYALLHKSEFIELHLLRANQSNPTLSILYNQTDKARYCVDLATLGEPVKLQDLPSFASGEPVKLQDLPSFEFHGSCNGLVCESHGSSITLSNPTTREYKELPPPLVNSTPLKGYRHLVVGFGWDPMKEDYKVLGLKLDSEVRKKDYQFIVYTLKTNSWREISQSSSPLWYYKSYRSMYLNGSLHWLVKKSYFNSPYFYDVIMSFDMGKEVFKEIRLPEFANEAGKTDNVSMGVLQECISASVVRKNAFQEQIDIWIMRRYREEESWSKQFSIEGSQLPGPSFEFTRVNPVGFQKGKLVLEVEVFVESGLMISYNTELMMSYNTETGSVEAVAIGGTIYNWSYLSSHVETLVSVNAY